MAKLMVANWKMNGNQAKIVQDITEYISNQLTNSADIVLAFPSPYLVIASNLLLQSPVKLASQDVSKFDGFGAFTGEVSATMLKDCGVSYTIVGHSERRMNNDETGSILLAKINNLLTNNITPIFCIGEAKRIRENGKHLDFLVEQLELLTQVTGKFDELVIAYEPIWSIGTGLIPTVLQITEVVNLIQAFVQNYLSCAKIRILYGGSVSGQNAASILEIPLIGGVLVGGASLKVDEFTTICSYR